MELTFRPGYIPEETILEVRVGAEALAESYRKIVGWLNEARSSFSSAGFTICSMGEYDENEAWADMEDGIVSVSLADECVCFTFSNRPEGEDALDGGHPDWTRARDTLWIDALPRVRKFLAI